MRQLIWLVCFFSSLTMLSPPDAAAQGRRILIIHPLVDSVIDRSEAAAYKLFQSVANFHSARIYQNSDSTFSADISRVSTDGTSSDSSYTIPSGLIRSYALRIDQFQEHSQRTKGKKEFSPLVRYADGTPLQPPFVDPLDTRSPAEPPDPDMIPLAPDTSGFLRPVMKMIGIGVGLGLSVGDLPVIDEKMNPVSIPLSTFLKVCIKEDPSIDLYTGWGVAVWGGGDGSIVSFSVMVTYHPFITSAVRPVVGIGGGRTYFDRNAGVIITASESYPMLWAGLNLIPEKLDIYFTYSITSGEQSVFEGTRYTIKPTYYGLNLLFSVY
jgi:hypothetical protein